MVLGPTINVEEDVDYRLATGYGGVTNKGVVEEGS